MSGFWVVGMDGEVGDGLGKKGGVLGEGRVLRVVNLVVVSLEAS